MSPRFRAGWFLGDPGQILILGDLIIYFEIILNINFMNE